MAVEWTVTIEGRNEFWRHMPEGGPRAVDYVRGQGIDIPAKLLSQVAPLPWAYIALTGDYLWNEIDRPLERSRPIRANRFQPNNFEFP